jgi:Ca2+-binding EF-hand superfamily protein
MNTTVLTTILGLALGGWVARGAEGEPKPKPAPALPDWVKKYDKNGDGKLDPEERAALQKERQAEMLKKYDKNSDGKLDEAERKAMAEERRKERDEAIAKRQAEQQKKQQEKKPEEKN